MIKGKTSEELLEGTASEEKAFSNKSQSDTSIYVKRLSVITDDDPKSEDLQIIGIKVNLEPDGQYSITEEKRKCKQADASTVLENPIKLKFEPIRAEDKEFELFIKSKEYNADSISPNERTEDLNRDRDEIIQDHNNNHEINTCKNRLSCTSNADSNSSKQGTVAMETAYLYSTATQTMKEVQSSSAQTTYVKVHLPKNLQNIAIQTDDTQRDATMVTDTVKTKSVEVETDGICNNSMFVQTEAEIVTGSSQTETAALYSIDSTYDASTQTEQVEDKATVTDFDIYIVNRGKVCDKNVDTQDLPYDNLIVAREEKARDRKNCKCHCDCEQNKNENSQISYHHTEKVITHPLSPMHWMSQQPTHISHVTSACCHECRSYDDNAKCDSNTSEKCYCKCKTLEQKRNKENQTIIDNIVQPKCLNVTKMEYASIGIREKINYTPQLQIVKGLGSLMKTIVAVPFKYPVQTEKAEVYKIPIVIQQFLVSFRLAACGTTRVVTNPIDISLSESQAPHPNFKTGAPLEESCNKDSSKLLKQEDPNQHLVIYNGVKAKSVTLSPRKSVVSDNSRICLCDGCYVQVQTAMQKPERAELSSDDERKLKLEYEYNKRFPTSISPKIQRKNFDYTSKDPWQPLKDTRDDFIEKITEAIDIVHVQEPSNKESAESLTMIDVYSACETVNDHLLNLRAVDEDLLSKSSETLHKTWFEVAARKDSDVQEVSNYLRYFKEFSYNLLKSLLHSLDNNGNSVLHFAYANNRFDLAQELLRNGYADDLLDKANKSGNSPLMVCAVSQPRNDLDWSIIRSSFQMGDVNKKCPKSGQTPLMSAASRGYCNMVTVLLELEADPNLQDSDGSTALMYAAEHGKTECVRILIRNAKCDPSINDKDGQSACSIALENGHKDIAVFIHMHALEKKRVYKRYVWTNNESRNKV